jgi:phage shock protein C
MSKKLYRDTDNQMIAGVCAGLAEYFEMDPTVVRLVAVLIVIMGGAGVLAYLIMWAVIPPKPVQ